MKNLKKMSLNLATKELSRKELKGIMAGSGGGCNSYNKCSLYANGNTYEDYCTAVSGSNTVTCYCSTAYGVHSPSSNGGWSRCWN